MTTTASKNVPFVDLKAQYETIREEVAEAMERVLENTAYILGPDATAFEEEFAAYTGFKYAVGVGNGTDALHLAMRASGLQAGDEVLAPTNTFIASTEGVTQAGGTIRLADVSEETFCVTKESFGAAISPKTKLLLPVALYGNPVGLDEIADLGREKGIPVMVDAAQAHGATLNGKRMGELADTATYSFYPGKNLGAYGDAGAVATNDPEVAKKLRMWRSHGEASKYNHVFEGVNSRLDGLQAAVLRVKLRHLDAWTEGRRNAARMYREALADIPGVRLPTETPGAAHVYHLYVIRVADRLGVQKALGERGVASGIHYPQPIHLLKAYEHLGLGRGSFPVAESACDTILSLPMYPELGTQEVEQVAKALAEAMG